MPPLLRLMRPHHWPKNAFLFAGLMFAEQHRLFDPAMIARTIVGFAMFCVASSIAYIINDILDAPQDRLHPEKRNRPIASGQVPVSAAVVLAVILSVGVLVGSFVLSPPFCVVIVVYLIMNILYTLWLKHRCLIDVMIIALGFVLRALAGVLLIVVPISPWLLVCTFTLCLFLGFGKRRCELAVMTDIESAHNHRRVLAFYSPELLSHLLSISAGVAILSFLLYTMDEQTIAKFGSNYLVYTTPLVMYGVFRFAMLVQSGAVHGPVDIIIKDHPFQATVVLWTMAAVVIVHYGSQVREIVHAYLPH